MSPYCYIDGQVKKITQANLPVTDLAILRGFAVFDFARIYNQKPFYLKDHFTRFIKSARILGLAVPISLIDLEKIIKKLLQKNKLVDASIKMVLTGGKTVDGISIQKNTSNFFILMDEQHHLPAGYFTTGTKLITYNHQRVLPRAKNSSYIPAVMLQAKKKKAGAVEILYLNNNLVLECTTSNIFLIKNKVLITPKDNILQGITRKIVIALARRHKIKVEEREVSSAELFTTDEVFITATNKLVCPIVKIDQTRINKGKVGDITFNLLESYRKLIAK
ncbi:MAG: aminotransferase class IV [Candidatus Paceibacterota bacterium]